MPLLGLAQVTVHSCSLGTAQKHPARGPSQNKNHWVPGNHADRPSMAPLTGLLLTGVTSRSHQRAASSLLSGCSTATAGNPGEGRCTPLSKPGCCLGKDLALLNEATLIANNQPILCPRSALGTVSIAVQKRHSCGSPTHWHQAGHSFLNPRQH